LFSTSSQGLSATTEIRVPFWLNLRFKDFVINHEHGRVKSNAKIPKNNFAPRRWPCGLSVRIIVRKRKQLKQILHFFLEDAWGDASARRRQIPVHDRVGALRRPATRGPNLAQRVETT